MLKNVHLLSKEEITAASTLEFKLLAPSTTYRKLSTISRTAVAVSWRCLRDQEKRDRNLALLQYYFFLPREEALGDDKQHGVGLEILY